MVPHVALRDGVRPEYIVTSIWICVVHFLSSALHWRDFFHARNCHCKRRIRTRQNSDSDHLDWTKSALSGIKCLNSIDIDKQEQYQQQKWSMSWILSPIPSPAPRKASYVNFSPPMGKRWNRYRYSSSHWWFHTNIRVDSYLNRPWKTSESIDFLDAGLRCESGEMLIHH